MKKNKSDNTKEELNKLAAFVHGSLFALHTLGMFYNIKKRNLNLNVFVINSVVFYLS